MAQMNSRETGRFRRIFFHAPLVVIWVQFVPILLRLPFDAQRWKWSAALWLATFALLPLVFWLAEQLVEWIPGDRMPAAFFGFSGMFALEEMQILGWSHPWRIILLATVAAIEFWGCAGVLLRWPGFERAQRMQVDLRGTFFNDPSMFRFSQNQRGK